jgi:hypothetical protein
LDPSWPSSPACSNSLVVIFIKIPQEYFPGGFFYLRSPVTYAIVLLGNTWRLCSNQVKKFERIKKAVEISLVSLSLKIDIS